MLLLPRLHVHSNRPLTTCFLLLLLLLLAANRKLLHFDGFWVTNWICSTTNRATCHSQAHTHTHTHTIYTHTLACMLDIPFKACDWILNLTSKIHCSSCFCYCNVKISIIANNFRLTFELKSREIGVGIIAVLEKMIDCWDIVINTKNKLILCLQIQKTSEKHVLFPK